MKVRELIEELKNVDPDSEVHFSYNYGDHWRTQVAPVIENADEMYVKHSDYHNMPALMDDEDVAEDQHQSSCSQANGGRSRWVDPRLARRL
jgi:hypothetical protein